MTAFVDLALGSPYKHFCIIICTFEASLFLILADLYPCLIFEGEPL